MVYEHACEAGRSCYGAAALYMFCAYSVPYIYTDHTSHTLASPSRFRHNVEVSFRHCDP